MSIENLCLIIDLLSLVIKVQLLIACLIPFSFIMSCSSHLHKYCLPQLPSASTQVSLSLDVWAQFILDLPEYLS